MSSEARGSSYEREAREIMESWGYVVEKAIKKAVWIKRKGRPTPISIAHDFFGAFDLIGKKLGMPTLWVQVSTWDEMSHKRKQVAGFPATAGIDDVALFGRVRGGRSPHFRVLWSKDDFLWTGATALVLRRPKGKLKCENLDGKSAGSSSSSIAGLSPGERVEPS